MNCPGCGEFFTDDETGMKSMNRLVTFIAIVALTVGFFVILGYCYHETSSDLQSYLGALTTLGIIIAGLGGFNYASGKAAGAYTHVRVAQAQQGIPGPDIAPPPAPITNINVGKADAPVTDALPKKGKKS